jgi:hypothetical protein
MSNLTAVSTVNKVNDATTGPVGKKDGLLVSVTKIPGIRNRSEFEGRPYGTQASHHNWPNCK